MLPRSRRSDAATFELVPDDERPDDGRTPSEDDDGPGWTGRMAERWRGLSRRRRVAVAATTCVAVLVVAGGAVASNLLDARDERQRAAAALSMPGGVGDLSEPLTPTWEATSDEGVVAVLAGGTLLTNEGDFVRAVDVADGSERWRRDVGPDPECGPDPRSPLEWSQPPDRVVCVSGPSSARVATVLDAVGTDVPPRDLGPVGNGSDLGAFADPEVQSSSSGPAVWPGPSGTVAVVDDSQIMSVSAGDTDSETLRAVRRAGWVDPTFRVEDATTGEVRGEATVHLRAEDLEVCSTTQSEDAEPKLTVQPFVFAGASSVTFRVCGAGATLLLDGTTIDSHDGWPQQLPGGGTVLSGETSTYLDGEGTEVATVPGYALLPVPDDGGADGPYLSLTYATDEGDSDLVTATARDGESLWTRTFDGYGSVLAQVAGTLVLSDGEELVGLDPRTGAERWTTDGLITDADGGTGESIVGAVTDGTRLLVAVGSMDGHRLVAVDVRDGRIVWERAGVGDVGTFVAVDGHPVLLSPSRQKAVGLG